MTKSVGSVIYQFKVNGQQVYDYPVDMELHQAWGKHEVMHVRVVATKNRAFMRYLTTWADDAPVEVLWGRKPDNLSTWYGYVNHHEVQSEDDQGFGSIQVTYTLVGTAKPMNTDQQREWWNVTPQQIAIEIAKEYKLRSVVTNITNWVLDYEVQAGESDFKFLNRMAEKVGFRFWVSGGTLYFIDPNVVLSDLTQFYVPHYTIDHAPGQQDTARDFHRLQGDNLPGGVIAQRSISGIDYSTGLPFNVVADGTAGLPISSINSEWHVDNYDLARKLINASQALNQFWIGGYVEVFGFTPIYPGKAIYLSGYAMPDECTGYWIVTACEHALQANPSEDTALDRYVTRCSIIKNTRNIVPDIKGVQKIRPEIIGCHLVNSKWQANQFGTVTEGIVAV